MRDFTVRVASTPTGAQLARRASLVCILALAAVLLLLGGLNSPVLAGANCTGPDVPQATCPAGGQGFADVPPGSTFYEFVNRLYEQDIISGYPCGGPGEPCDSESKPYFRPANNATRGQVSKIVGNTFFPGCNPPTGKVGE